MSAGPQELAAERVRSALERALAREGIPSDLRPRHAGPLERILRWLVEWLEELGPDLGIPQGAVYWVLVLLFAAVLGLALVLGLRVLALHLRDARLRAEERADRLSPAVRRRVAELAAAAAEAAAGGERALALRLYLFALVVGWGEHGELEFRPAWTGRELLARGRPRPEVAARLSALLDELDPKTFGRAPASDEDVARLRGLCEGLLAGEAA